jgi:hypothetical protein
VVGADLLAVAGPLGRSVLLQAEKRQIKTDVRKIRAFSPLSVFVQIIILILTGQRFTRNSVLTFDPTAEVN